MGLAEKVIGPSIIVYNKSEILDLISSDYSDEGVEELYRMILSQYEPYEPDYLPVFLTEAWRL